MGNELHHYGITGMKWGVRRKNPSAPAPNLKKVIRQPMDFNQNSNPTKAPVHIEAINGRPAPVMRSDDSTRKDLIKIKGLNDMTNAEIKQINERLQLEKSFRELTKPKESAGRKFVSDVVTNAAKQTATTYVAKYMSKGIDELLKKAAK